ncbi:MAG TPA: tRNA uridine-5-carboxymethylaminomethyl(34) synthesis GTPase MnmE [Steroidobacteraceae bacterium]
MSAAARRPETDTIVAPATPPGRGAIAIVRLSGPRVPAIATTLLGALPTPRTAVRASFGAGGAGAIDSGIALYFPAPHSYTGEHVLELQGHAGPVIVEALVRRLLELGARRAQPGEFTQRAYLNGKLDLAQAEAVVDLIDAASEAAARAAMRSLQGEFSLQVHSLGAELGALRVQVEAAIDFADEDLALLPDAALLQGLEGAAQRLATLFARSGQGRLLNEGMTVVIAGAPNAGKSTLLNRLAGHEAAIVTALPGTTRDVLRERIQLDGLPLHVLDTAGLRAQPGDAIEAEGIRRAEAALRGADRILFVIDAATDPQAAAYGRAHSRLPAGIPVTLILNKMDLCTPAALRPPPELEAIRLCARSGEGVEGLRAHLQASMSYVHAGEGALSARARHLEALARCGGHLRDATQQLLQRGARELVAEELRCAQQALGEILGNESSDELLGRIFAAFCVGK